jgi:hypothetical protein
MKINAEYIVVMRQYVELSETILEGLQYIVDNSDNPNQELSDQVFNDSLIAIHQLHRTTEMFCNELQENELIIHGCSKINDIIKCLTENKECLGRQEERNVLLANELIPMYQEWKKEIEMIFSGYIYH